MPECAASSETAREEDGRGRLALRPESDEGGRAAELGARGGGGVGRRRLVRAPHRAGRDSGGDLADRPGAGARSGGPRAMSAARALHDLTAAQASSLVRGREISSLELVEALLARIARLDPMLRSFVTVDAD